MYPYFQFNNGSGINYAETIDDVKNQLVFQDTLFINKNMTLLWYKMTNGDVKSYSISEIIIKDEKDLKIEELEAKIKEMSKDESVNANDDDKTSNTEASNVSRTGVSIIQRTDSISEIRTPGLYQINFNVTGASSGAAGILFYNYNKTVKTYQEQSLVEPQQVLLI